MVPVVVVEMEVMVEKRAALETNARMVVNVVMVIVVVVDDSPSLTTLATEKSNLPDISQTHPQRGQK